MPRIEAFLIDDRNIEKFAAHGLSDWQVVQVLENPFLVVPNRADRTALLLVVGSDNGGRCIAIPIEATLEPGVWRPVTAWSCKSRESQELRKKRGMVSNDEK